MSEPINYGKHWSEVLKELNAENARLKAEVERLKAYNEEALAHIAKEERKSRECLDMEQAENARLKAEVERLRKAGDAMVFCMNLNSASSGNALRSWENAKDGNQP